MAVATRGRLSHIFLALYLILAGLGLVVSLHFVYMPLIMGVLALIAGVLLLAGR